MALRCAQASLVALLAHTGSAVRVAKVSAQAAQPDATSITARSWISDYYAMVKVQQNPLLDACCKMAKAKNIQPWLEWGSASTEDQQWWNEVDCNTAVGAEKVDFPVGVPNCVQGSVMTALLPNDMKQKPSDLFTGAGQCSLEDRMQINNTFLGTRPQGALTQECAPTMIAQGGQDRWEVLAACTQKLLGVSMPCASCYSDVMKGLISLQASPTGCVSPCYSLEACASAEYCVLHLKRCTACIQPKIASHLRCLGGPVENQFNTEDFMRKLVHAWGSPAR